MILETIITLPEQEVITETIRNLEITTSTCKRIVKELHSYEKEVEREAAKTAHMKDKELTLTTINSRYNNSVMIQKSELIFVLLLYCVFVLCSKCMQFLSWLH